MKIIQPSILICTQLLQLVKQLTDQQYKEALKVFSGATFGQHTRHIIEFYQCLLSQNNQGTICYDSRDRDINLEESVDFAIESIEEVIANLSLLKNDFELTLQGEFGGFVNDFPSSLSRELLYALEHAVHHMAIIKIGIIAHVPSVVISADFGVAESTIKYREEQCAQ